MDSLIALSSVHAAVEGTIRELSKPVVILSCIHAALAIYNNTMLRRKKWQGWAGSTIGACLYTYVNWLAGTWGSVGLGVFYMVNAVLGIRQWRRDTKVSLAVEPS